MYLIHLPGGAGLCGGAGSEFSSRLIMRPQRGAAAAAAAVPVTSARGVTPPLPPPPFLHRPGVAG